MDLIEAEDIKKKQQQYTELYTEDLNDWDNHDGVITIRYYHHHHQMVITHIKYFGVQDNQSQTSWSSK